MTATVAAAHVHREETLEPDLPIVDAHHHLVHLPDLAPPTDDDQGEFVRLHGPVVREHARYLVDELLADVSGGHDIRATVFVECGTMYRRSGPSAMRSVGEVEYVNGIAAMSASGMLGDTQLCAAIVGGIDLGLGAETGTVLDAQFRVGGGRFRGVRVVAIHADPSVLRSSAPARLLESPRAHAALREVLARELSLDVTVLEPQLPEVVRLARTFPELAIVVDHVGFPLGIGSYRGTRGSRFPIWRDGIRALAACENVVVKLGGLGTPFGGFPTFRSDPPATSQQLADDWRPYIETCIEEFGADRCMFESNYPADAGVGDYGVIWNALKRLARSASPAEKHELFTGTATRTYRLDDQPVP